MPARPRPLLAIIAAACAVLVGGSAVLAQTAAPAAPASPLDPLYACTGITDPTERLACFDRTVAELRGREARQDVVAMDRQQVEQVQRESFGFNLPSLPNLFGGRAQTPEQAASRQEREARRAEERAREEALNVQTMTVTQVRVSGGRTTLTMDNQQVWQFVDAGEITPSRRVPFQVTIRRATLGSFLMSVEGSNRGYRVRRIQ